MPGTVLLISNRLPTDSGGRAEKIATRKRLLERHGWNVTVAHAPEPYFLGAPTALGRCIRLGRQNNVDVILSINNPFHLHVLGYFTSRALRKPWLAELRDPIATHPDRDPRSPITWAAKAVEHLVVHRADRIVWFDGIQLADDYFEKYDMSSERIIKLPPIGYEKEKFDAADADTHDDFTITYAGSFYEGWIEPYTFLTGLGKYIDRTGDQRLRIQFYGDWSSMYRDAASKAGVVDYLETNEFIPHEEIISVLKGSDLLLYIGGSDPGNRRNLPSKLWDYVGARRPILAVVDPTFRVAEFVREHNLGLVADATDSDSVANTLAKFRDEYTFDPNPDVFERYTRERSTKRIAELLDEVSE